MYKKLTMTPNNLKFIRDVRVLYEESLWQILTQLKALRFGGKTEFTVDVIKYRNGSFWLGYG